MKKPPQKQHAGITRRTFMKAGAATANNSGLSGQGFTARNEHIGVRG